MDSNNPYRDFSDEPNPYAPPPPTEANPFASPLAEEAPVVPGRDGAHAGLWVEGGRYLMAAANAEFPDRCVKCNAPARGYRLKKTYTWHPPWIYLIILVALLLYVIVALVTQKKIKLAVGLCERHRRKRALCILTAWVLVAMGFLAIVAAVSSELPAAVVAGVLMLLGGILTGIIGTQTLTPQHIDNKRGKFKGACPEFLQSVAG